MTDREVDAYCYCEVLAAGPGRDLITEAPRVGVTLVQGEQVLSVCFSLNDAAMLLRQIREALGFFATLEEYPDAE